LEESSVRLWARQLKSSLPRVGAFPASRARPKPMGEVAMHFEIFRLDKKNAVLDLKERLKKRG
jgi:hypothetical protein